MRMKNKHTSPAWSGNFVAPMPCIVYTTQQEKGGGTRELHPDAQGHPCCGFDLILTQQPQMDSTENDVEENVAAEYGMGQQL